MNDEELFPFGDLLKSFCLMCVISSLFILTFSCSSGASVKSSRKAVPNMLADRDDTDCLLSNNFDMKGDPIIKLDGTLTRSEIRKGIDRGASQILQCFEDAVRKGSGKEGSVQTTWIINSCGGVSSPEVKSNPVGDQVFEECLLDAMTAMQFKKPSGKGNVFVSYPFTFELE